LNTFIHCVRLIAFFLNNLNSISPFELDFAKAAALSSVNTGDHNTSFSNTRVV